MDLDLRHLRPVVAIADAGSLSGAARVLGLQQPTVSTQLRRIEESLGGPLFERSASGVQATPRGVGVLRRARSILERLTEFDDPQDSSPEPPATTLLDPSARQPPPSNRWTVVIVIRRRRPSYCPMCAIWSGQWSCA